MNLECRFRVIGIGTKGRVGQCGAVPAPPVRNALFEAIPSRQSTRGDFDGQLVASAEIRALEAAGQGDGMRMMLFTETKSREDILAYLVTANLAQMRDTAFKQELKSWARSVTRMRYRPAMGCSPSAPATRPFPPPSVARSSAVSSRKPPRPVNTRGRCGRPPVSRRSSRAKTHRLAGSTPGGPASALRFKRRPLASASRISTSR